MDSRFEISFSRERRTGSFVRSSRSIEKVPSGPSNSFSAADNTYQSHYVDEGGELTSLDAYKLLLDLIRGDDPAELVANAEERRSHGSRRVPQLRLHRVGTAIPRCQFSFSWTTTEQDELG